MLLSGNEAIHEFMDKLTLSTNVSKYVDIPMTAVMGRAATPVAENPLSYRPFPWWRFQAVVR